MTLRVLHMKNITLFTTFLLLAAISNGSVAINSIKFTTTDDTPVPEIIACEQQDSCEMTKLHELYENE